MNKATGLQLLVEDINWIVNLFKDPPFIQMQYSEEWVYGSQHPVVTSVTCFYGVYEIFIDNAHQEDTFIRVIKQKNKEFGHYRNISATFSKTSNQEALRLAQKLIKKNSFLLD